MGTSPPFDAFGEPAVIANKTPPRKSLWRRARQAYRLEAKEFCLFTGLHGYKYIVQPGKHRLERFFWLVVVTVSMAAAVYLMVIAYDFHRSHPTILAVDNTHYPLWRVEAPGVTVCPSNIVLKSKALRLVQSMELPPDVSQEEVLSDMPLLVELITPRARNTTRFLRLQGILDKNKLGIDYVLRQVTPTCDELLVGCVWKRRQCLHCSDIFRLVRTAYGYCCSFNYLDRNIDEYRPRMGGCVGVSYQQVQRLSACGYTNGLSVAVRINRKELLSSFIASHAVMMLIHNPDQYPDSNADLKVVGAGTVSFISYLAQVTEATVRLKRLPAVVRKCLFPDETYLPMFKSYTYENCMASCQANRTLEACGCAPVIFPHVLDRRVCDLLDLPCVTAILTDPTPSRKQFNASTCPLCWPLCENVEYTVETSVGVLNWDDFPVGEGIMHSLRGSDEADHALFHVFAHDLVTTKYKMNIYMTREDLLGSLGGLSGLFVGFSLVCGFEFVYFFTIRPFFRMRARQAASRAASRESSGLAGLAGLATRGSPPLGAPGHAGHHQHPAGRTIADFPHPKPFPLAAPHVFKFRRRAAENSTSGQEKDERKDRSFRRGPGGRGFIAVIE